MATRTQALTRNWRLKLSALALSIFLWALVQTEPANQETFASVPVLLQIADTTWTAAGPPDPSTVEVRLGGPAREIIRFAREGTTLRIPVESVTSRDTLIALRREWVQLGQRSGLTVESVSPANVRVSFEEARVRLVPVAARVLGEVPSHLAQAAEFEVSPQLVRVRGPESRLAGLDSVRLLPFDLADVTASGSFSIPVDTATLLGASVVPRSATLDVRVEPFVERVLEGILVEAVAGPGEDEVIADPESMHIRLSGPRTLVTALDAARLRVWLPPELLSGMEPGEERTVSVQVDGVPSLVTATPEPSRITVRRSLDQVGGGS